MNMDIVKQKFKVFFEANKSNLLFLFSIVICVVLYHLFYFNKFLSVTDGWFYVLTKQFEAGMIPYKDFHFCLPPMYILLHSLVNHLFGDNFINIRIFGIIERCIICGVLFITLKRITSGKIAFISVMTAFMLMTSVTYDLISSPVQSSIFMAALVLYCWCRIVEIKNAKLNYFLVFLIGFLCFISAQFKQTTGIILFGASLVLTLLINLNIRSRLISFVTLFLGFAIPHGIEFFLFYKYSCFAEFINQVFLDVAGSKGGMAKMLAGLFANNYNTNSIILIIIMALLCCYVFEIRKQTTKANVSFHSRFVLIRKSTYGIPVVVSILSAGILGYQNALHITLEHSISYLNSILASIVFAIVLFVGIKTLTAFFKGKRDKKVLYLLVFSGVACANIISSGLSIFFDTNVIIIGVAFVIALLFNLKVPFNNDKNVICTLLCLAVIFFCALSKYLLPYCWWGWRCIPVREATLKLENIPNFKGFVLPEREFRFVNDIYNLSEEKLVSPRDYIYTFPNIPLPYAISGKIPREYSSFPHIDVYPDYKALKEAEMILKNPPKILIFVDFDSKNYFWQVHEKHFRADGKCAQRQIDKNIRQLIKNKKLNYKKYSEYNIGYTKKKEKYRGEKLYVYYR